MFKIFNIFKWSVIFVRTTISEFDTRFNGVFNFTVTLHFRNGKWKNIPTYDFPEMVVHAQSKTEYLLILCTMYIIFTVKKSSFRNGERYSESVEF